jgi:hypothetical protein
LFIRARDATGAIGKSLAAPNLVIIDLEDDVPSEALDGQTGSLARHRYRLTDTDV